MELARRVSLYKAAEDSVLKVLAVADSIIKTGQHSRKLVDRLSRAYKHRISLLTEDLIAAGNRDKWANRFVTSAILYPALNLLDVSALTNISINAGVIGIQWLFDYELFNLFHVSDSVKRLIL